ncbi:MAG: translation elongation factor Ts [Candidatus Saganbacteria bacterium]|nr:translation elongation factor Ts [Candidatus Saganbacteria bacterium]
MAVTPEMVKELREKTGCGMMDCKKALEESGGDMAKAAEHLRKKGLASAAQKAERAACQGIIESYIHLNSNIGVMIELNCETDFVARNPEFKELARDIAMQVCAASPMYVSRESVPQAHLDHEKEIIKAQSKTEGKPEHIIEKMMKGRIEKFYSEVCLVDQLFIKDQDKKISDLIKEKIAKFGENIVIKRFTRYQVGEKI